MHTRKEIQEKVEKEGLPQLTKSMPPETTLETTANIHRALSSPTRLKILHMLKQTPLCVCMIKELLNIQDSKLSYHLNILKESNLAQANQDGNWIIYSITDQGQKWVE